MVQYFPIVTGSLIVSGSITATGGITVSGSIASASFAANAATASFVTTAQTASFVTIAQTASFVALAQTASSADNFLVRNTLTAQTLVVQTITSSIDFVTGSTRFGSLLANTHQFTGSVSMTGSLAVVTNGTEFQVGATGVNIGNIVSDIHNTTGSLRISGSLFIATGSVGVGTLTPDIFGRGDALNVGISTIGASDNMALSLNAGSSAGRGSQIYMGQGSTRHFTLSSNLTESTLGTTSNTPLIFTTNDSSRMRITSDGDVNITGRTDRTILNVGNSSTISNNAAGRGNIIANGSSSAIIQLLTNSTERGYFFHNGTDSELWNTANGYLRFGTNNTERVRIANDGKVGIGTSTPSGSRLHVFIGNDGGSGTPGVILATSNGANDIVRFQDGTTTVAVVKNDGRFGIKTTNVSEEASLFLGAQGTNEGGQLILQRATSYASASHLDNYQNTFRVMSGTDTISSAVRFSVDMTNGSFKFGQSTTGNVATYTDSLYNATRTYTITGTTNGLIQIMVGVYLNGAGTSARAMWFGGGYLGGGSLPYTEILRVNGTYLTISAMNSNPASSVFTIQNTFVNTADINIMIISSGFNASPTLTMT